MNHAWFVIAQAGDLGPQIAASAMLIGVAIGDEPFNTWMNGGVYKGWQPVRGPFTSQAQAQTELAELVAAGAS